MDELVFVSIVIARLAVPLLIPRFPLPAILAALVIDAADQTVFAAFDVEPDNYQGYDKALDIYYLAIAYISTLRNWAHPVAFRLAQFLWYYRLAGVVAFELSQERALLLIFPNTFEYFFIFYEAVRLVWNPQRLSDSAAVSAAVGIWVFIKLPQEWWIHIAQLDVTDFVADNPWVWPVFAVVSAFGIYSATRIRPLLPSIDWPITFDVDTRGTTVLTRRVDPDTQRWVLIDHPLFEKTLLVGLVSVIFWQLLPSSDRGPLEITVGVGLVVVLNSWVSGWLSKSGRSWAATGVSFLGTGAINLVILVALKQLTSGDESELGGLLTFLQLSLLTLIGTLYDRYRQQRIQAGSEPHTLAESTSTGETMPGTT